MTTYFITRHLGAKEWAKQRGISVDRLMEHLDPETIQAGDVVIGSLPVNLAAQVCERSARYLHLSLKLPSNLRGKELTAADMHRLGARIEEYRVQKVGGS